MSRPFIIFSIFGNDPLREQWIRSPLAFAQAHADHFFGPRHPDAIETTCHPVFHIELPVIRRPPPLQHIVISSPRMYGKTERLRRAAQLFRSGAVRFPDQGVW